MNERRQGLRCPSREYAKDNVGRGLCAASEYNRNRGRFRGVNFTKPQQDLIDNLGMTLRETNELESCREQQQQALQRFLALGLSYNAAALMAHEQYPCQ
jgi:hypothetical protein